MLKNLFTYWKNLTLGQEITIILLVKLAAIMLIWWLFFKGQKVEVTPDSILDASTLQATQQEENY